MANIALSARDAPQYIQMPPVQRDMAGDLNKAPVGVRDDGEVNLARRDALAVAGIAGGVAAAGAAALTAVGGVLGGAVSTSKGVKALKQQQSEHQGILSNLKNTNRNKWRTLRELEKQIEAEKAHTRGTHSKHGHPHYYSLPYWPPHQPFSSPYYNPYAYSWPYSYNPYAYSSPYSYPSSTSISNTRSSQYQISAGDDVNFHLGPLGNQQSTWFNDDMNADETYGQVGVPSEDSLYVVPESYVDGYSNYPIEPVSQGETDFYPALGGDNSQFLSQPSVDEPAMETNEATDNSQIDPPSVNKKENGAVSSKKNVAALILVGSVIMSMLSGF
jgi:hypothetical protein